MALVRWPSVDGSERKTALAARSEKPRNAFSAVVPAVLNDFQLALPAALDSGSMYNTAAFGWTVLRRSP
jgi:hypothetical protein